MTADANASAAQALPRRVSFAPPAGVRRVLERVFDPESLWSAVAVWAIWAVVIGGAIFVSQAFRPYDPWPDVHRSGFLWPARVWDYAHYYSISQDWYPKGHVAVEYAFFPLWGVILAIGSHTIGAAELGTAVAIAASGAVFLGIAYANPLASPRRTAIALACMPTSYILLLVYPDGLALAAAVWASVFASRQRWVSATALGIVAAAARPNAFLVALVFLYFALRGRGVMRWVAVAAPPLVFVTVMTYFWQRSGDLFAFTAAQKWARGHPWQLLESPFTSPPRMWDGVLAVFAITLCVLAWRSPMLRVWAVYATAVLAMSLGSGTVWGIARHMFLAFPLVWALAGHSFRIRVWPLAALGACLSIEQAFIIIAQVP